MTEMGNINDSEQAMEAETAPAAFQRQMGRGLSEDFPHYHFLADIPVRLSVEVGSVSLKLSEIMNLAEGAVIELDRQANELLDINVNGTCVAKGEVVTVDGRFGIKVIEVMNNHVTHGKVERRG